MYSARRFGGLLGDSDVDGSLALVVVLSTTLSA